MQECSAFTHCPSDIAWDLDNSTESCYYVEWINDIYSAEALCKKHHQDSDLVTIDNYQERDLVLSMISEEAAVWLRKPSNDSLSAWVGSDWDSIGNGDYCLFINRIFTDWPVAKYCFANAATQVICELAGK